MFEELGFESLSAARASLSFAIGLGILFGIFSERLKFCFRRALIGEDRRQAAGIWAMAVLIAVLGTQYFVAIDVISFDDHRFMNNFSLAQAVLGGLAFGAGMVLTRSCVGRLTVLASTGNLRAVTALLIFAITAHAALKGAFAPVRTTLSSVGPTFDAVSLASVIGSELSLLAIAAVSGVIIWKSGASLISLLGAALIGALVVIGWVGTGFVLFDDFDPIAFESIAFTSPWTDSIFWTLAATAVEAKFGVGLVAGVVSGAFLSAALSRRLSWQSFDGPSHFGRVALGAGLMGIGGVLAGGCTIGAGLSGFSSLSIFPIISLFSIAIGALVTHRMVDAKKTGLAYVQTGSKIHTQPAE